MNSRLNFGDTKDIINEFQYLMDTLESIYEAEFKYFYRITDDNYIQLAYIYADSDLNIIAQFKFRYKTLKENLLFIVKQNIEARYLYEDFPVFERSAVFTEQEFNGIIQSIVDEKQAISEQARANQTPLINYLKENNLNPTPSGNNPNSWIAKCPCGGNHFIMIVTTTDSWGCGYCRREGELPELKAWLQERKIKEDQKRLSRMLQELKDHGELSKETSKWWMNRY